MATSFRQNVFGRGRGAVKLAPLCPRSGREAYAQCHRVSTRGPGSVGLVPVGAQPFDHQEHGMV